MTGSGHGGHALRLRDAQGGDEAPALDEIRQKLQSIKIDVRSEGRELGHDYLTDALIQAVDTVLQHFFPHVSECEEEPDTVKYGSGIGYAAFATTFCWGKVRISGQLYHIYVDYYEGYNSSESWACLKSIEIIPHSRVIGDD